jgi:predicted nucleotidyltransferase
MPDAAVPIPNRLQETLCWATETLRKIYGPRLKRLILFGSYARGEARLDSDVDLLVVLGGPVRSYEEAKRTSRIATKAAAVGGIPLSFVHVSEEAFAENRHLLVESVKDEGIDLLDAFSESSPSSLSSEEARFDSESDAVSIVPDRSGR